ncbi:hypothetical protein GLOIN_2v1523507 [Rhizophagus clarus]|uniref:F-box domain-containing protein n=1 Tax=Rhizophagus clarus TaxID=94130 RepID=A0A8H3M4E2_9GLOM|nr:hypothetical protein GLOIN_2v1523507 [Rhizophagus clarus]
MNAIGCRFIDDAYHGSLHLSENGGCLSIYNIHTYSTYIYIYTSIFKYYHNQSFILISLNSFVRSLRPYKFRRNFFAPARHVILRQCQLESFLTYIGTIQVSRVWCIYALPILWRNPWFYIKNSGTGSDRWRTGLITTYVATLPRSSKDILTQAGIKLPYVTNNPVFDYSRFLKGLHICSLEVHVIFWILLVTGVTIEHGRVIVINPLLRKKIFIVIQELVRLFFRKSSVLYSLNAGSGIIVPEILANVITEIPEAKTVLTKLRTFTCGSTVNTTKFMAKIVSTLSNYSRNIQQLEIHPYEDINELSKLIRVQKYLSTISMEENHTSGNIRQISWKDTNGTPYEIIKKAQFITRLTIGRMYFPVEELSNFVNLEELILSAFGDQDYPRSKWIQLTGVSLKKLKIFYFCSVNSTIYLDIFANFIKNCKGLQQIIIHSHKLSDPKNSGLLIANIAQYCPNIILYEGPILQENSKELTKLLQSCHRLKSLHLRPSKGISDALNHSTSPSNQGNIEGKVNFDTILKEITEKQPQSLHNLRISDGENGRSLQDVSSIWSIKAILKRFFNYFYEMRFQVDLRKPFMTGIESNITNQDCHKLFAEYDLVCNL